MVPSLEMEHDVQRQAVARRVPKNNLGSTTTCLGLVSARNLFLEHRGGWLRSIRAVAVYCCLGSKYSSYTER
jgi:hypothetical protein